jgi:hypothetical protein
MPYAYLRSAQSKHLRPEAAKFRLSLIRVAPTATIILFVKIGIRKVALMININATLWETIWLEVVHVYKLSDDSVSTFSSQLTSRNGVRLL